MIPDTLLGQILYVGMALTILGAIIAIGFDDTNTPEYLKKNKSVALRKRISDTAALFFYIGCCAMVVCALVILNTNR